MTGTTRGHTPGSICTSSGVGALKNGHDISRARQAPAAEPRTRVVAAIAMLRNPTRAETRVMTATHVMAVTHPDSGDSCDRLSADTSVVTELIQQAVRNRSSLTESPVCEHRTKCAASKIRNARAEKQNAPVIAVRPVALCKTPRNGRDSARDCRKKSTVIAAAHRSRSSRMCLKD